MDDDVFGIIQRQIFGAGLPFAHRAAGNADRYAFRIGSDKTGTDFTIFAAMIAYPAFTDG